MENETPEQLSSPGEGQSLAMPLLTTKLFVPPARPTLVPRPRLVARLSEGLAHPLTLISAPAGFGKTTLVSEWRASAGRDVPLAWLSLDEQDNDPTRFLTYLSAALGTVIPDIAGPAPGMLRSPQPPPLQAFLTYLINDLNEFRLDFALVLDDYHAVKAGEVHAALAFLLDHMPPHVHLVLLTRADPPLPLARLRARGQLVEIRAAELRFTSGEAAAFFRQSMGLALSPDAVAALEQRTEGWVAALQLAALAIQAPRSAQGEEGEAGFMDAFLSAFSGSHHYVADYLSAEVLNRQPEQVRTFLLQTSILDRMTAELCDRLTGRSDGQATLRQLDQANLFLVPLDEQRRWYRYHPLFAELLRSRLRESAPDRLPDLHRRAAGWYEQHGLASEAIRHALAAGDQQQAARIVEGNAMAALMRGDSITVLNWIASVASLVPERPWLGIYQSWALIITGQIEQVESLLQGAERRIASDVSAGEGQEMGFHVAAIRALVAGRRGESQQAIGLARRALERLPASESAIRSVVLLTLADASWATGDLAGAMQAFQEVARMGTGAGNFVPATGALSSVAGLLIERGELHRAAETYRGVIRLATRPDGRVMPTAAHACLGLAGLAYEWNDLEAAGRHAQQALELGRRWGNPDTLAGIYLEQARLQAVRKDHSGASEALRQAEELARGPGVSPVTVSRVDALRLRWWLAQDDLEATARWARRQGLDPEGELSYSRQIDYLTLARVLIAQDQTGAALALLERLMARLEALGQMGRALELLLLRALALETRGDTPRALSALARALALGEPEGYVRVFLDEGPLMVVLLRRAGSRGIAPKFAARLLSEFNREAGAPPAALQALIEPLTDRELQVLRLIAEGLSNQAIADRLIVALGTVKTHTASLYRKLGVSSRTQAVARAADLGLL